VVALVVAMMEFVVALVVAMVKFVIAFVVDLHTATSVAE